jgi:hypothetical protein
MVIEIIKDMMSFSVILIYWILGVSIIFYLLASKTSTEEAPFTITSFFVDSLKHTYRVAFGDFDTDNYSSPQWVIFILTSLFIPLVMFNLVIAIMGDTYDRV